MKAPDKIYFNPDYDIPQRVRDFPADIEYVRTDALLEWANNYKKHIDEEQLLDDAAKSMTKSVLDDVIDKLKSL